MLSVGYQRSLSQYWNMQLSYNFTEQDNGNDLFFENFDVNGSAISNAVFFTLSRSFNLFGAPVEEASADVRQGFTDLVAPAAPYRTPDVVVGRSSSPRRFSRRTARLRLGPKPSWRYRMDNNNSNFQGHPFYVALALFNAAVKTPFEIAAAFWRPWFADAGKKKVQDSSERKHRRWKSLYRRPRVEIAAIAQAISGSGGENVPPFEAQANTKAPKPKKVAVEKGPTPPTKRTLKEELELEREERAQKTERLRKLRQMKDAANPEMPPSNGHGGARRASKH